MNDLLGNLLFAGVPETTHSIEAGLCKLITDHIETPIFRSRDQATSFPCLTYRVPSNEFGKYLDGGLDGDGLIEFDVTIWSESYSDLPTIGKQLRSLLDNFAGQAWDRVVLCCLHEDEADELQQPVNGSTNLLYGRTQTYKVDYRDE